MPDQIKFRMDRFQKGLVLASSDLAKIIPFLDSHEDWVKLFSRYGVVVNPEDIKKVKDDIPWSPLLYTKRTRWAAYHYCLSFSFLGAWFWDANLREISNGLLPQYEVEFALVQAGEEVWEKVNLNLIKVQLAPLQDYLSKKSKTDAINVHAIIMEIF